LKLDPRHIVSSLGGTPVPVPKAKDALARLASRVTIAQAACVREAGSQTPVDIVVKDISVGGARIATHLRLRPNQRVTLSLQIGADTRLELPARVIHSGDVGKEYRCLYGLRFDELSEDVGRNLSEFVYGRLSARGASLPRLGKRQ
jgi:c-di-GMP-binding flagellar brake protein YcgR